MRCGYGNRSATFSRSNFKLIGNLSAVFIPSYGAGHNSCGSRNNSVTNRVFQKISFHFPRRIPILFLSWRPATNIEIEFGLWQDNRLPLSSIYCTDLLIGYCAVIENVPLQVDSK